MDGCTLPAGTPGGQRPRPKDVLCVGHQRRSVKSPNPDLQKFIEDQASARPILKPRGARTARSHYPPIDFTRADPQFVEELRWVTATKIGRNTWRGDEWVNQVLRETLSLAERLHIKTLHELAAVAARATERDDVADVPHSVRLAAASMARLLEESRHGSLMGEVWHPRDHYRLQRDAAGKGTIRWGVVTCDWLREGLMSWGRQSIQAGTRSWNTVRDWCRAGGLLSRYMEEVGWIDPSDLGREAFLDFLSWVRTSDRTVSRQDLNAVSMMARLLDDLRYQGIVSSLPDVTYLRRGENPVPKKRAPKPFPADILDAIDRLIATEDDLEPDVRLLLRVFRAVCPRPNEALTLPLDCIEHGPRGYTLNYFQSKTQERRRVPLPEALGRDLAAQAERVQREHPGCAFLFPYLGSSPRINTLTATLRASDDLDPWPYGRFRDTVWTAYQRHGITRSSTTGEVLTGAQLHRFRHSVATGLLQEGWSQYEVQKFLGHTSPTMMQAYAEIHEDTLRTKYEEFVKHSVDVTGQHQDVDTAALGEVERLRDRMVRSALPNGYCTLPENQTCDFVPSPCLTCKPFFRTTPTFLPIHIRQRDESLRELELAKESGRDRAIDAHTRTVEALNAIIDGLEAEQAS